MDENGFPIPDQRKPIGTELDAELRSGDRIEVSDSARGQDIIKDYFGDLRDSQYARQSRLLLVSGGSEIKLYVRSSVKEALDAYIDQNRITNVAVFSIP